MRPFKLLSLEFLNNSKSFFDFLLKELFKFFWIAEGNDLFEIFKASLELQSNLSFLLEYFLIWFKLNEIILIYEFKALLVEFLFIIWNKDFFEEFAKPTYIN